MKKVHMRNEMNIEKQNKTKQNKKQKTKKKRTLAAMLECDEQADGDGMRV
jgi:hypothetical protein